MANRRLRGVVSVTGAYQRGMGWVINDGSIRIVFRVWRVVMVRDELYSPTNDREAGLEEAVEEEWIASTSHTGGLESDHEREEAHRARRRPSHL